MGDPAWELAGGSTALGTSPQPPALIPQLKAPSSCILSQDQAVSHSLAPDGLALRPLGAAGRLPEPCGNAGLGDASKVRCLLRNEIGDDATGADKWPVTAL